MKNWHSHITILFNHLNLFTVKKFVNSLKYASCYNDPDDDDDDDSTGGINDDLSLADENDDGDAV